MAIQQLEFWYDAQMKRFLAQLVRAFSGFQVQPGMRQGVQQPLMPVPCQMASTNKMVGNIMRNQSENTLLATPMITIYQSGLSGRREDVQNPGFTDTIQVVERAVVNGAYTTDRGNAYSVERMMPRPFEMTITVDIWTSNLEQKHQLAEQILTVMYPTFDIQNSENGLDMSALTMVRVEDITWSSRSLPITNDSDIDVMSITLKVPFWMAPPAKVTRQRVIETILTNIRMSDDSATVLSDASGGTILKTQVTTPHDLQIKLESGIITALNRDGGLNDHEGNPYDWSQILLPYGIYNPGTSAVLLYDNVYASGTPVSGIISFVAGSPNQLVWQPDITTLPANTLPAVNALIDPMASFTDPATPLAAPAEGTRYLILSDISPCVTWPGLTARENDIIQFANGAWTVAFAASAQNAPQTVLNSYSNRQLTWNGSEWIFSVDRLYSAGFWRLAL